MRKGKKSRRVRGKYIKNYNTLEIIILVIFISRKIEKTLSYITFFFLQKLRTNKATSKLIEKTISNLINHRLVAAKPCSLLRSFIFNLTQTNFSCFNFLQNRPLNVLRTESVTSSDSDAKRLTQINVIFQLLKVLVSMGIAGFSKNFSY